MQPPPHNDPRLSVQSLKDHGTDLPRSINLSIRGFDVGDDHRLHVVGEPALPNARQLLVRLDAVLLKPGSVESGMFSDNRVMPPGSEACGTVIQIRTGHFVSSSVVDCDGHPITVGTRVVWSSRSSCGQCFCCRKGFPSHCLRSDIGPSEYSEIAVSTDNSGIQRIVREDMNVLAVPLYVPPGISALIPGPGVRAASILKRIGQPRPAKMLIAGVGMTSVILSAMLKREGVEDVVFVERRSRRRKLLRDTLGLASFSPEEAYSEVARCAGGFGVDVAVNLSREYLPLSYWLPLIRLGGSLLTARVQAGARRERLSVSDIASRHLTVQGCDGYDVSDLINARRFLIQNHQEIGIGALIQSLNSSRRVRYTVRSLQSSPFLRVGMLESA